MAIVKMKHLRLIALMRDRDALLRDLANLGAVEIREPEETQLKRSESDVASLRAQLAEISAARMNLTKYVKFKRGMFAPRAQINADEFFSPELCERAIKIAEEINSLSREIQSSYSNEARTLSRKEALAPWRQLDTPLDTKGGEWHSVLLGTLASKHSIDEVISSLGDGMHLECVSTDKEQHYVLALCHKDDEGALLEALRPFGFSKTQFKDVSGTAREAIDALDKEIEGFAKEREQVSKTLSENFKDAYETFDAAQDALSVRIARAEAQEKLCETDRTVVLTGWFPEREEKRLCELFEKYGAAYEMRAPNDDEKPPTLTYNSAMVRPYEMITNMYSAPSYREVDPNPLMAPFFAVFFGIMFSDAAYGILLTLVASIVLIKFKPRGGVKQMMSMGVMCGITTFIWGVLFGGFFGDAIPTVYKMITGKEFAFDLALWFNPLDDPMLMLIFSFALGGIHIFAGMAVKAYIMIRDGEIFGAIFDIGSWWVLFGGIIFALTGLVNVGLVLIAIGALALLLTQGRHEKKFFKKITKGLSSLYDITSYLGDILSYSRLLALSLATAVIASVINTMGAMTGPIGFMIVFLIGHTFNIAVNLIGTYVHTSRLQYVEFFGKFYEGGGDIFSPLDTKTKYVDIVKEEK